MNLSNFDINYDHNSEIYSNHFYRQVRQPKINITICASSLKLFLTNVCEIAMHLQINEYGTQYKTVCFCPRASVVISQGLKTK